MCRAATRRLCLLWELFLIHISSLVFLSFWGEDADEITHLSLSPISMLVLWSFLLQLFFHCVDAIADEAHRDLISIHLYLFLTISRRVAAAKSSESFQMKPRKKHARLWNVFSITPHNIRAPERGKTIGERWRVEKKRQKVWTSSAVLSNYNKKI